MCDTPVTQTIPQPTTHSDTFVESVDFVPKNTLPSLCHAQLFVFEDEWAGVRVVIESCSPKLRVFVARSHRVDVSWLLALSTSFVGSRHVHQVWLLERASG